MKIISRILHLGSPHRQVKWPYVMGARSNWTFLSNHAHVVVALAKDPTLRLRDIAALVNITERAVAIILADLEEAGVVSKTRVGRRNAYTVHGDVPLRHPMEAHRTVADILRLAKRQRP